MGNRDREALKRAFDLASAESEEERAHIERIRAEDGWQRAAETAAYHLQDHALGLQPWQPPPCWIRGNPDSHLAGADDGIMGWHAAAKLVQRLLACGLSRFEPNPERALATAEARAGEKLPKSTGRKSIRGETPVLDETSLTRLAREPDHLP
jgi:hypothetical protein